MTRSLRLAGYIGIGIAAGLTLATLLIALLTRSEWGMERARRFVVSWLDERVEGELRLGRITGPGLLGGVVIHDFAIVDPRGRPFLSSDSLELAYDWRTLLAGRIVLNRVVLYRPDVVFERLPGDTAWNYEYVFPPGEPGDPGQRSLILFNDARVLDGRFVMRMPWEPEGPVQPADTARIVLEPVPGGLARTMRFEDVNGRLNRVIWESPIEPGRLFDVQMLQARGYVWREPFQLRNARGTVTARDSVIAFDMPDVSLPASNASVLGRVVLRTGPNDVDVRIEGRRLAFGDLQWLYPNMPEDGGGSLTLRIQSQPGGILWLAEDARIATGGTNVAGSVGVVTGDTLYFTRVDLRASPLDVELLERLLPGGLPVEGLLVGTVEVRGPLSALETSGDLRLTGDAVGTGSRVAWRGVLDVSGRQVAARSLRADVTNLELALISALNPGVHLTGRMSGRVQGSGRLDRLSFTAALEHESDGGRSTLDGSGSITGSGGARHFDLMLNAAPVTLEDLAVQVPALRGLAGELRGPVHVTGSGRELRFAADLHTPGGELHLAGNVLRAAGDAQRISATARADRFRLHAMWSDLPETLVTGRLVLDITGDDLATAAGTVRLELDSARVRTLPLGALLAGGELADGLLHIDSATLYTVAGIGRANGSLGLVEGRHGRVQAGFVSESLTPLEAHVFGDAARAAAAEPRLAGRLSASVEASGWIGSLDLTGSAAFDDLVFGGTTATRLRTDADGTGLRSAGSRFRLTALADSLRTFGHVFPQASANAVLHADSIAVDLAAGDDATQRLAADVVVRDTDDGRTVRVDRLGLGSGLQWTLSAPATMTLGDGTAALDGLELRRAGGGAAWAGGRLAWSAADSFGSEPVDFRVDLSAMPFTDMLGLLRSREAGAGRIDGRLRVTGTALDPLVEMELNGAALRYGEVRIDRAFAEASYATGSLDVHAEAQHGGRSILTGGGRVPLDLRFADVGERRLEEELRFTITADSLPPALPLGMLEGFSKVGGRIDGTLAFSGTTLQPALSGGFVLRNGVADWNATGVGYRDVRGTFVLEDDRTVGVDLRARTADPRPRGLRTRPAAAAGEGRITGTLGLHDLADPTFDLVLAADRTYAAKRRDVEAFVSGAIRLGGRYSRPEVSGALRVENGALYIDELYRQYLIVGLEVDDPSLLSLVDTSLVAVRPLLATSQSPFLRNVQIRNLQVEVGNDSWLRSRDMDVEVSGNLNVTFDRMGEDLRLLGLLNVERGTYTLYYPPLQSRRFQVREGTIEFPGTPGLDPNLAITASYRVRSHTDPLDVLAMVSGTLQSPRVRLTSDAQPPISESDLASYIFFGVPTWQVANNAGPGAGDVRAMAGLALRPSVLGYASSGLQTLVQSAGLFDYVSLTAAETAPGQRDGQGLGNLLTDTQLELGRYLPGTNIYVGYTQRLGTAGSEPAGRLEWRFLPEFTFELFVEDRFARTPGLGLRSESWLRKVYGFALFREWGF